MLRRHDGVELAHGVLHRVVDDKIIVGMGRLELHLGPQEALLDLLRAVGSPLRKAALQLGPAGGRDEDPHRVGPFAGHLVIQAGIAAQQAPAAQQLIEAQVQALAAGDFDVATLAKVKAGLLNQYLASQDDENYLLGRALAKTLLQQPAKLDYPAALAAVTPAQVAQLADQLVPAAVYLLSGDE